MRSSNWPRYLVPAKHDQAAIEQDVGDLLVDDALGEALDDRRLADAGLAEEDGVVLGAAAEDLHDALDLVHAADDRVELAVAGEFGEVATEAVERGGLALGCAAAARAFAARGRTAAHRGLLRLARRGGFLALDARAEEVEHLFADFLELEADVHEDLGGHAIVLAEETEEQVLRAHIVVVQVSGFLDRVLDDLLGARGLRELAHRHHLWSALDELLNLETDLAQVDVEVLQHIGANARAFLHEAEQDVLRPDVLVVQALRLLVGQGHHLPCTVGQSFEHEELLPASASTRGGCCTLAPPDLSGASARLLRIRSYALHAHRMRRGSLKMRRGQRSCPPEGCFRFEFRRRYANEPLFPKVRQPLSVGPAVGACRSGCFKQAFCRYPTPRSRT